MTETTDRETMLRSYMELAQRSWSDEEFKRRLESDPRAALAEAGWQLSDDTKVDVTFYDPEALEEEPPSADEITAGWARGIEADELRLLVPDRPPPQLESSELSDEELASASGGICSILTVWGTYQQYTRGQDG